MAGMTRTYETMGAQQEVTLREFLGGKLRRVAEIVVVRFTDWERALEKRELGCPGKGRRVARRKRAAAGCRLPEEGEVTDGNLG